MATRNPRKDSGIDRSTHQSASHSSPGPSGLGPSSAAAKAKLLKNATSGVPRSSSSNPSTMREGDSGSKPSNSGLATSVSYSSESFSDSVAIHEGNTESGRRGPLRPYVPRGSRRDSARPPEPTERAAPADGIAAADTNDFQRLSVNAAFMWEIKSVNEDLWLVIELLQTLCRRPHLIPQRGKRLVGLLEQLLDLVAMQFTLEEAYGYFDDPEHVEAAFSAQAVDLRDEHVVLYESLMGLVDRAQEFFFARDYSSMTYRLPASIAAFIEQFHAHDRRECDLTMTAMNVDLGVGD